EVVDMSGAPVRRLPDMDIRVTSETEIQVTLQAPADPTHRLPPGRYGFRVTNPDGTPSSPGMLADGGVLSSDGGAPAGRVYTQGCHATNPSLFNVVPPPEVSSVEPVSACSSRDQQFIVHRA